MTRRPSWSVLCCHLVDCVKQHSVLFHYPHTSTPDGTEVLSPTSDTQRVDLFMLAWLSDHIGASLRLFSTSAPQFSPLKTLNFIEWKMKARTPMIDRRSGSLDYLTAAFQCRIARAAITTQKCGCEICLDCPTARESLVVLRYNIYNGFQYCRLSVRCL